MAEQLTSWRAFRRRSSSPPPSAAASRGGRRHQRPAVLSRWGHWMRGTAAPGAGERATQRGERAQSGALGACRGDCCVAAVWSSRESRTAAPPHTQLHLCEEVRRWHGTDHGSLRASAAAGRPVPLSLPASATATTLRSALLQRCSSSTATHRSAPPSIQHPACSSGRRPAWSVRSGAVVGRGTAAMVAVG